MSLLRNPYEDECTYGVSVERYSGNTRSGLKRPFWSVILETNSLEEALLWMNEAPIHAIVWVTGMGGDKLHDNGKEIGHTSDGTWGPPWQTKAGIERFRPLYRSREDNTLWMLLVTYHALRSVTPGTAQLGGTAMASDPVHVMHRVELDGSLLELVETKNDVGFGMMSATGVVVRLDERGNNITYVEKHCLACGDLLPSFGKPGCCSPSHEIFPSQTGESK